jgi:hypothetical protein
MTTSAGERDKKMNEMATKGADAFCRKYENLTDQQIEESPEPFLRGPIAYLTVRTLQRQETVLTSLEADSRRIKAFTILTGVLTLVLVALTIALARYANRLDVIAHSLHESQSPTMRSSELPSAGAGGSRSP